MPGGPLEIAEDGEAVAILPGRWSDSRVADVMERLFAERAYTPAERLQWRARDSSPYPVRTLYDVHGVPVTGAGLYCGHNPILTAIKVQQLRALDEFTLSWNEVAPSHARHICNSLGFPDCPHADQPGSVTHCRWTQASIYGDAER
jgi:hypothetical protein